MSADPYYSDDLVTLYHGDCREILPTSPQVQPREDRMSEIVEFLLAGYGAGAMASAAFYIWAARTDWHGWGDWLNDGPATAGGGFLVGVAAWPVVAALALTVLIGKALGAK